MSLPPPDQLRDVAASKAFVLTQRLTRVVVLVTAVVMIVLLGFALAVVLSNQAAARTNQQELLRLGRQTDRVLAVVECSTTGVVNIPASQPERRQQEFLACLERRKAAVELGVPAER